MTNYHVVEAASSAQVVFHDQYSYEARLVGASKDHDLAVLRVRAPASAGVGFAVPIDTVNRVVPQLIVQGHYRPPRLGIRTTEEVGDSVVLDVLRDGSTRKVEVALE